MRPTSADRFVPGGLYADLFDPSATGPDRAVSYEVWNRIYNAVPEDYRLPDIPVVTLQLP